MKKTLTMLAAAAFLASCGNSETKKDASGATANPPAEAAADAKLSPEAEKGLDLIAQSDCLGCHKVDEKLQGPSYREVAAKYAGQGGGIEDTLAQRIIKGHVGVWGDLPMTPHPTLSEADAKAMVAYVMSLKQ